MNSTNNQTADQNQPLVISYLTLRKMVGLLGSSLPIVLVLGSFVFGKCKILAPSVSQYYYSTMGDFFVGTLCAVAIFLFSYKGYNFWDKFLTNAAGFFAVGAAFFPTHSAEAFAACNVNNSDTSDLINIIHFVTSGLFFICLSLISIVQFTRSKGKMTPQKKIRNRIYKICGYAMLASILLIGVYRIPAITPLLQRYKPTFFLEAIALIAFGISWLTKGEFLLKDD